jgi:hypothetical protein
MKKFITTLVLCFGIFVANAQVFLDYATIEDIVKNEREYFDEIVDIYKNDDPMIRLDDIALVYYGQAFLPQYNPGNDENEKALKRFHDAGNHAEAYNTAKKIIEYNPVSLNALFNLLISSKELGKSKEEFDSYANKYQKILNMITEYGKGNTADSPFKVINPDDQNYVLFHELEIEKEISRELDTETLCNIIVVEPSTKYQYRRVYFDLSLFLKHTSK